jgi:hypothetical protein
MPTVEKSSKITHSNVPAKVVEMIGIAILQQVNNKEVKN